MDNYNKLHTYYKDKFGERVLKICVDGGFTCPNRDGTKGYGGCAFCGECGSGDNIKFKDVKTQVINHLASYRGKRANKFIVYFQNFSNTYGDVARLKQVYDSALVSDKIIGIAVATRPDCVNEEVVKLLQSYQDKYFVMVELGLQTADEKIAEKLNLKYLVNDFFSAVKLLKNANIETVAHIMVGLPNENKTSIDKTIKVINESGVDGLKIHNLYIIETTLCEKWFNDGKIIPLKKEEYLDKLEYIITHLNKKIILHRITGDAPKDKLVAPKWNVYKKYILNGIDKRLREKNLFQGVFFEE